MKPAPSRRAPARPPATGTVGVLFVLLLAALAGPAQAQESSDEAARRAAEIARADSIRARLDQPPGDRGGLTAMDVIRTPFQLVGGALALTLTAGAGVYALMEETGVLGVVLGGRRALAGRGIRVDVDSFGPRSGPGVTVTVDALDPLRMEAGHSWRRYERYGAGLYFGDDRLGAEVVGGYALWTEPHFWGVGPDSRAADRSDFERERTHAGGHVRTDFGGPVTLRLGAAWERTVVARGSDGDSPDLQDTFAGADLYGVDAEPTFLRWAADLDADFTERDGLNRKGVRLQVGYRMFRGLDDTDADFHRIDVDARAFLPLSDRHVLAVRGLAEDHLRERGRGVPFTHLAELGEDHGLRGYRSRRFRDRAVLAGQAELRWEVWWHPGDPLLRIEGFGFADYGAVGSSWDAVEGDHFELTPGLGLRVIRDAEGLAEAYIAWGGESAPRVDASLGVTF